MSPSTKTRVTATFTVTLGNATTAPVTFNYATSNGTATAGTDYTATTGSGSIAAGATTATFTVAIADDFIKEGNETFNVTLSGLSTNVAASGNDLLGVGTITDTGSTPPTETITAADTVYAVIEGPTTVAEGATTGAYTVKLVDQAGNSVTVTSATNVTVQFANGTAEAGDYAAADQTVTIAAGSSSATLTVATNEDVDFDNETFTASIKAVQDNGEFEAINISSGAAGQTASATTTIVDNDVAPTISINDVTVNEDAGTATFTVTLGNATTAPVTFNYATSNGTATAGTDYTATTGSGSIAAGATTATFTVAIADDFIKEGNETFNVTLSGLSTNVAASGNDLLGVGTITDTGSTPPTETITAADTVYAVIEGPTTVAEGATTGAYTVKLVDQAGNSVTVTSATNVTVQFANGTAEAGDYAAADQTVTIAAGSSSATLTVATNEDVDFDNETFTASIKAVQDNGEFEAINISSGAAGQTASATTTIVDNDVAPTISINDVTVNEDAGTATFTVTLGNATTAPVTFNYATSNGTATAGTDYTATTGSGSIAAGATTATFTVAIADDFIKEGNETFNVTLSGLSTNVAASGNDLLGVGTITDTGSTPPTETITAADTVYAVIEGPTTVAEGATTGAYTVKLVDQAGNSVTVTSATNVTVQFANGTAEAGDYAAADQTVTIAAGSSSATLTVATNEDVDFDNETFTASIKAVQDNGEFEAINISSGAAGQTASATTTIVDNDVAPTISINDVTVNEDAGTATFTVTLGNATTAPVTFNYATSNGTATAGTDYTATTGSGSIAAGATTATFTVAIADDFIKEGNETFNVTLSGLSTNVAASGNDLLGVGTITDTGSTPPTETITAADTVYAVIEGPTTVAEGATTGAYTVKLVDQAGNSVTVTSATNVTVQFANGTAEAGDYAAADQTVTIAAGSSSATLTVATNEDVDFDNETFTASIKAVQDNGEFEAINISSGAAGQTASATTTIVDNDVAPTISINDVTVNEDAGTATFTVTLGNATTAPVTFNYATSNGTATAGTDYTATTDSGSIAAGATTATFTVAIADDFIKEGNETFNVTLSGLSTNVAASGNDLLGVGTITDTGSTPPTETITAADTVYAVIEGPTTVAEGATTSDYTVRLIDQFGNPVTVASATSVTVRFANGSAEDNDYQYGNGVTATFTIAAGASSVSFPVSTVDDLLFESDETFSVSIAGVKDTGAFEHVAIGASSSVTTTILNNDTLSVGNTAGDDDDVNENRDNISTNDIQHTGTISPVAADITLSIDASGASGLTSNHQAITYAWSAASRTLTASTASGTVFSVTLSASGDSYAFKQFLGIDHAVIAGEAHSLNIPLTLLAKDSAGNQLTTAGFSITVADDAPSVSGTKVITTANDGNYSESGFLTEATLSNDVTGITWNTAGLPSLVFEGKPVLYVDHGNGTLTGQLADGTLIFRATIDPTTVNGNNSPQYSFELLNSVGRLGVLEAESSYTVISGGNINHLQLGFGDYLIDSMTAVNGSGATSTVNTNNNWIGVGGNWFNPGEKLSMAFTDPSGAAGQVRDLNMLVEGQGNSPYTVNWKVTAAIDANGTTVTYSGSVSGSGNSDMPFSIPLQNGALYFTNLDISSSSGDFRIAFSDVTANNYFTDIPLDLSYTLTDADGDTANGLIDVTLTANHVPRAGDDSIRTEEDTSISGNLATNDTLSLDGGNIWALGTQASHGTALVNADGTFTYTPAADYNGSDAFTYTLTDANGDRSTATVQVSVTPVNDATSPTLSLATIGQWTFNEASGAATTNNQYANQTGRLADDNSSGGSALPSFTSTSRNATAGNNLNFQDAGDRVNIDTSVTQPLMGTATLTFWVKTTQAGGVSGAGNSWDLPTVIGSEHNGGGNDIQWGAINNQGKIGFGVGNVAGVYSTSTINDGNWQHVAITRNAVSKLVEIYVNGVREATGSPNDPAFTATINKLVSIGVNNNFSNNSSASDLADNRYFNGQLDDLRIYAGVLTQSQITAIRNIESGFHDTALANDGGILKFTLTPSNYTSLTISGLEAGMTIADGAHSITASGDQQNIDLTGWSLSSLSISNTGTASATLAITATNTVANGDSASTTSYLTIANGQSLLSNGTSGSDTLNGSNGADIIRGGEGNDILNGGSGNDRIEGGNGNDTLLGGSGNDVIFGGAGNDILVGGTGNDTLWGGSGADTFVWQVGNIGKDVIKDFKPNEGDRIDLRDLLVGEENAVDITQYLRVDTATSTLEISTSGDLSGTGADVTIKLENGGNPVDLSSYGSTSSQIVNSLIAGADPMVKIDHT
ncbi:Calx-beta domain-containing protein [Pseudomonas paeninsulae]|uniref:Calx-beta domain-containing protein n=1 Tax=Pseudomonas paeninsulae TaxID=3110772 RepID=UPI002D774763|nr:Calx-beta domain-containing protein [Pseudomonas sp. IT1137]